ncbi:MAG: glycosyltransferase family 39 protein, partial [Candidatus Binatia bacterium]
MNSTPERFDPKWPWFVGAVAFGLVLRLIGLGRQSLWLDEMTSIQIAEMPLRDVLNGRNFDNHTPPLYYILLHYWRQVVPLTEYGLRLFSAGIDAFNILLLGLLCRRFISDRLSFLVVSAYAISPFALYYAQEGRMYTLTVFFALLYTAALERLVTAERRLALWATAGGIVLALGVYTHYYIAFYALGVFTVALFAVRHSHKRVTAIVSSGLLAVLLFAPWIPIAVQLAESRGQAFRIHIFSVVPYTFFRFVIGYAVFPLNMHTKEDFVGAVIAHASYLIAVVAALLLLGSALIGRNTLRKPLVMAAGWVLVFPMALALLISLKVPMISERYLIVSFPAFLLIGLGFQDLTKKRSFVAVGLFFVLLLVGDIAYFFNPLFGKTQWREAAAYVERTLDRDGAVFVEPDYAAPVFQYY